MVKVKEAMAVSENFLKALEMKEQEMLDKYEQLERIDALIDELKAQITAMVLLNLRGKVYKIQLKYLLSDVLWCSYFPVMLLNEPDPTSGEYFIDCASEGFDRILDCTKGDEMKYNLKDLNAFEIGSINRNLLYLRLPYRRNEYQFIGCFDAMILEDDLLFNIIQLRDGRLVTASISPFENSVIRIWNITGTTFVCEQTIITGYMVWCLLELQDGRLCVGATSIRNGVSIDFFDLESEEIVQSFHKHQYISCDHQYASLFQLTDGRLCSIGGRDHTLRVWDVNTGECMVTIVMGVFGEGSLIQLSNGFVVTGFVVTALSFSAIKLWDPVAWECVWTKNTVDSIVHILELDNGNVLSSHLDNVFRFWDVKTGVLLRSVLHGDDWPTRLLQLQDGRLCVYVQDGIKIMSLESGEWEQILENKSDHEDCDRCLMLQLEDGRLVTSLSNNESHTTLVNVWST